MQDSFFEFVDLERVNARHFWNPGVFSYAMIPRCRPTSRGFFSALSHLKSMQYPDSPSTTRMDSSEFQNILKLTRNPRIQVYTEGWSQRVISLSVDGQL